MFSDREIWQNIQLGDATALRLLHDRYFYPMCFYSRKILNDQALVEEIVSDCFIKLWVNRESIVIHQSVRNYLYLMLRNAIIDFSRKKKTLPVLHPETFPDFPDEQFFEEQEFYAKLYQVIERLPEQRRRILELAAFESLTYKEIAERLEISVNTVKTQMGRAYQYIKEQFSAKNVVLLGLFLQAIEKNQKKI
jgi:RNA polymerase sigma-70 factor (ECF subfamily)